jgi:hypothetical protein
VGLGLHAVTTRTRRGDNRRLSGSSVHLRSSSLSCSVSPAFKSLAPGPWPARASTAFEWQCDIRVLRSGVSVVCHVRVCLHNHPGCQCCFVLGLPVPAQQPPAVLRVDEAIDGYCFFLKVFPTSAQYNSTVPLFVLMVD